MSELVKEPSDAEFSAMMDKVSPSRQRVENEPEPVAVEQPAVEAEEVEPTVAVGTEEEAPVDDLPEKYRGKPPAELAKMHAELEQAFKRRDSEITEARQLRLEMDALKAQFEQQPEPAPWETSTGFEALDEQVLTNPKETLDYIRKHQPQLYPRAMQTWANIDPYGAGDYNTEVKLQDVRSEYEQQLAAVRAPVVAAQNDVMLQTAYTNVANNNPLLASVAEDIPALLEENPEFKVLLGNGDVATRERALNNLVAIASSRRGVVSAPADTSAAQAAQAKKIAATVAAPGSSAERGQSGGQSLAERMLASEGTSVADELARNRAAYAARQAAR